MPARSVFRPAGRTEGSAAATWVSTTRWFGQRAARPRKAASNRLLGVCATAFFLRHGLLLGPRPSSVTRAQLHAREAGARDAGLGPLGARHFRPRDFVGLVHPARSLPKLGRRLVVEPRVGPVVVALDVAADVLAATELRDCRPLAERRQELLVSWGSCRTRF